MLRCITGDYGLTREDPRNEGLWRRCFARSERNRIGWDGASEVCGSVAIAGPPATQMKPLSKPRVKRPNGMHGRGGRVRGLRPLAISTANKARNRPISSRVDQCQYSVHTPMLYTLVMATWDSWSFVIMTLGARDIGCLGCKALLVAMDS
jgi:hypothetical protein